MSTGEAEVVDYIDTLLDQAPPATPAPAADADPQAQANEAHARADAGMEDAAGHASAASAASTASTALAEADGAAVAAPPPAHRAAGAGAGAAPAEVPSAPAPPAAARTIADPVASAPATAPTPRAPRAAQPEPPPAPAQMSQAPRWLRVVVGGASYALELLRVQEVVRLMPIVQMRGAQPAVLGVMNLRGRIVPVFDLGLWLGTGRVDAGEQSRIVVVERDDELIGLLVDAVEDVVTLGRDRIEPPLAGDGRGVVLGVARVGSMPTVLFDAYALYG